MPALPVPVILLTGTDPVPLTQAMVGMQWDLPGTVAVRHHIDVDNKLLIRVVSDIGGQLEHEEIPLEHACVPCTLRADIVPTLERLARTGTWTSIVAMLPIGAAADQVCTLVETDPTLTPHLRIRSVLTALTAQSAVDDLLGDDLLVERDLHNTEDDRRGVGEVGCAMIEYADIIVLADDPNPAGSALVHALARPNAHIVDGTHLLSADLLSSQLHNHEASDDWAHGQGPFLAPARTAAPAWQLVLEADRAFHPERLHSLLGVLGGGRHRSRGHFWLPSRPESRIAWDGSGGQLSIGDAGGWTGPAQTSLVLTGVGVAPRNLISAFEKMLMRPGELWSGPSDGFEPWLGEISRTA